MNNKQAIEVLKKYNVCAYLTNKRVGFNFGHCQEEEVIQALNHAINCVGAIEQIKWERDIAIQQLNELGYDLGEKIREEDKRVKIISETIDGVKTGLIIPKADKE